MDRVGLYLQDKHVRKMVEYAQYCEKKGFESVWCAESRLARDALTPITAMATVTSRIRVGSGVINTWTRNAALIAQIFATLDELSDGRAMLGLGAWWDPLAWKVGIERHQPLQVMREYVEVIRRLFKLETVTYEGKFVKARGIRLERGPLKIPIYIGATGWKMMELAGEIADGVQLNYLVSPKYNETAMEHIAVGASKVGRRMKDIDRPQLIACSMDEDADKAFDGARPHVTMTLGQQPHIMKASGVKESLIEEINETLGGWPPKEGGLEKAQALVSDEIVSLIAAVGTPDDCRKKVRQYVQSGCTVPLLLPLGGNIFQLIDTFAEGYL